MEKLSDVSDEIQLKELLGPLAEMLDLYKKQLRRVIAIVKNPNLEVFMEKKGEAAKRRFAFGFKSFTIPKRDGGEREIQAPHPELQKVFKAVKEWLEKTAQADKHAYGCVKEKSIKDAMQSLLINEHYPLLANTHFFRFDIKDAFPSITDNIVAALFESLDVRHTLAQFLAQLVTYPYRGARRLPQGSSCSPIILNLVFLSMCADFDIACNKYDLNWLFYVDDFHFAGLTIPDDVKKELMSIPPKFGFAVHPKKITSNRGKTIPHVLGLTSVDGNIHIKRENKKKFRRMLYAAKIGAYSDQKVIGITGGFIGQIYGKIDNWPGWLRKPYQQYQAQRSPSHKAMANQRR